MTVTSNFNEALEAYSDAAKASMDAVQGQTTDEAETQRMAGFTQLSGAAQLQFDQRNRAGFDAVVDLMTTTAEAAEKITTQLVIRLHADPNTPGPTPTDYTLVNELRQTLEVLAQLSPSGVWTASSGAA